MKLITMITTLMTSVVALNARDINLVVTEANAATETKNVVEMNKINLRDALSNLAQIHLNQSLMYKTASNIVSKEGHPDLQQKFIELSATKEKQGSDINSFINSLGGTPVVAKKDTKGSIMEGYVKIDEALRGLKGLFGGLETNAKLGLKYYNRFTDVPTDVKETLDQQLAEDQEILNYLTQQKEALN